MIAIEANFKVLTQFIELSLNNLQILEKQLILLMAII